MIAAANTRRFSDLDPSLLPPPPPPLGVAAIHEWAGIMSGLPYLLVQQIQIQSQIQVSPADPEAEAVEGIGGWGQRQLAEAAAEAAAEASGRDMGAGAQVEAGAELANAGAAAVADPVPDQASSSSCSTRAAVGGVGRVGGVGQGAAGTPATAAAAALALAATAGGMKGAVPRPMEPARAAATATAGAQPRPAAVSSSAAMDVVEAVAGLGGIASIAAGSAGADSSGPSPAHGDEDAAAAEEVTADVLARRESVWSRSLQQSRARQQARNRELQAACDHERAEAVAARQEAAKARADALALQDELTALGVSFGGLQWPRDQRRRRLQPLVLPDHDDRLAAELAAHGLMHWLATHVWADPLQCLGLGMGLQPGAGGGARGGGAGGVGEGWEEEAMAGEAEAVLTAEVTAELGAVAWQQLADLRSGEARAWCGQRRGRGLSTQPYFACVTWGVAWDSMGGIPGVARGRLLLQAVFFEIPLYMSFAYHCSPVLGTAVIRVSAEDVDAHLAQLVAVLQQEADIPRAAVSVPSPAASGNSAAPVRPFSSPSVDASSTRGSSIVLLHLGVANTATTYRLESRAYNCATFRVPDANGWSPQRQELESGRPGGLEGWVGSALPLEEMAKALTAKGHGDVLVSTNAGRFICNW
eukprot:XP_001692729.1 predicted protein [Chlamydomonas reinhardtii]